MTAQRSIVVVGHDASRTGAPVALASVLRWVRDHTTDRPTLALLAGGPLVEDYRTLADTIVLESRRAVAGARLAAGLRAVRPDTAMRWSVPGTRRVPSAEIVLSNTLASLPVAVRLAERPAPTRTRLVCHVHELDGVAARVLPADPRARSALVARVDRWVATGPAVADMLVQRFGVAAATVHTVDGFIEAPTVAAGARDAVRRRLGAHESPLVLSSGALIRRKGPERFVDLMAALADHPARPVGRWLGGNASGAIHQELVADIGRLGRPEMVRWVASVEEPAPYLAAADVVVSTSVEDPYPLVALEAGALGVPVVGYGAGGLAALLADAGQADGAVPVGDLAALASLVAGLLDDPASRAQRGRALAEHVRARHLVEHQVPTLWSAVVS